MVRGWRLVVVVVLAGGVAAVGSVEPAHACSPVPTAVRFGGTAIGTRGPAAVTFRVDEVTFVRSEAGGRDDAFVPPGVGDEVVVRYGNGEEKDLEPGSSYAVGALATGDGRELSSSTRPFIFGPGSSCGEVSAALTSRADGSPIEHPVVTYVRRTAANPTPVVAAAVVITLLVVGAVVLGRRRRTAGVT